MLLQPLLAVHVVDSLGLLVGKDLVRASNLGEGLGITALIGMMLQGFHPVRLLDLLYGSRPVDAENFVVVLGKREGEEGTQL